MIEERAGIPSLRETLLNDRIDGTSNKLIEDFRKENPEDETPKDEIPNFVLNAQIDIYRKLRPTNPPTINIVTSFFNNLFFNNDFYDLSEVGRWKIIHKLGFNENDSFRGLKTLRREDIL
ncbi:MAG: hypothetical protein SV487_04690, partial [Thermodesulfobacteriota bacterium]|nr:hypothetical protein [Thermodesulfobacteriota bacterium]